MQLTHLNIKNFRGIEKISLPLDDLCVLIGENNTGKSSIIDALRLCMTRSPKRRGIVFEEYDYHLENSSAEPYKSNPIEITLTFSEAHEDEWSDEISQRLLRVIQSDDNDIKSIILRVTSSFDAEVNDYVTDYNFLDSSNSPLLKGNDPRQINTLQQIVPVFYLDSLRNAAQEFHARSQFWKPFIRTLKLDDTERKELEYALAEVNKMVLAKHTTFESVIKHLKKMVEIMSLSDNTDPVSIEAVPSRISEIISSAQVHLASKTGAHIPIAHHGSGTQSLVVIGLFDAYLQSKLKEEYGEYSEPLLALEEPETHLHPSAINTVGKMLEKFSGQKIISTHSGDLLVSIPLHKIRRLRRKDGKISVYKINEDILTSDEIAKINYHVRTTRGNLLFSRCWLLVEGETDARFLSECARIMGYDLHTDGVSCIEYAQVGVEKFINLADQFGIEWFVLADNDDKGKEYKKSAAKYLKGRKEINHIFLHEHVSIEVFFCMEGFGDIYKKTIADNKRENVTADVGTLEYWQQVVKNQIKRTKIKNALAIVEKIAKCNMTVPNMLQKVIEQSRKLARSAG